MSRNEDKDRILSVLSFAGADAKTIAHGSGLTLAYARTLLSELRADGRAVYDDQTKRWKRRSTRYA